MDLKPEDIQAAGYSFLYKLQHDNLIPFVQEHLFKRNVFTRSFLWINVFLLGWAILQWSMDWKSGISFWSSFGDFSWGFLLSLTLVPLHEYIHGLAYKSVGAKKIGYTANWKQFYFTAQADHFVADYEEFMKVAFAPFIGISILCLALVLLPNDYALILISTLFWHTTMCGGDFAIASYFYQYKALGIITYDDFENKETFFFIKSVYEENDTHHGSEPGDRI